MFPGGQRDDWEAFLKLTTSSCLKTAREGLSSSLNQLSSIFQQRRLPELGYSNQQIELLLHQLSLMESNNFPTLSGVGEREGRVFSDLVHRRHYGFAHGVGRSGGIAAYQPKAAGSFLISKLTPLLVRDILESACNLRKSLEGGVCILPVCTGMGLSLCFSHLIAEAGAEDGIKTVIMSRIDQKSCLKSVGLAGCSPLILELKTLENGSLRTDLNELEVLLQKHRETGFLAVLSCTSCFAPREPDRVVEVAQLCEKFGVPHVINNAYGLQSSKSCYLIEEACRTGRVDYVVQSLDKNFMTPVGGCLVLSPSGKLKGLQESWPGRGSQQPVLDLFITLLSMGRRTYRELLRSRTELYKYLRESLEDLQKIYSFGLIRPFRNDISIAIDLSNQLSPERAKIVGGNLFSHHITGARMVIQGEDFGGHSGLKNPMTYMTVAVAIGCSKEEIDRFLSVFEKVVLRDCL